MNDDAEVNESVPNRKETENYSQVNDWVILKYYLQEQKGERK